MTPPIEKVRYPWPNINKNVCISSSLDKKPFNFHLQIYAISFKSYLKIHFLILIKSSRDWRIPKNKVKLLFIPLTTFNKLLWLGYNLLFFHLFLESLKFIISKTWCSYKVFIYLFLRHLLSLWDICKNKSKKRNNVSRLWLWLWTPNGKRDFLN